MLSYYKYHIKTGAVKVKTKLAIALASFGIVLGGTGLASILLTQAHAVNNYSLFGSASQQSDGVHLFSDNGSNLYSGITLNLPAGTTVGNLSDLEATFQVIAGHCGGGSPRFSVETPAGNIFVYMGDQPSFTSCSGGPTGNLLTETGSQIDASQLSALGGTYGDTWSHVVSIAGSQPVNELDIVADGGWLVNQAFVFSAANVNTTNYNFVPVIRIGSATGGLTLSNPRQQISFNAFDNGPNPAADYGTVEYQNFDYPGGLHYSTNVQCATVSGNKATFMFQIPGGFPGLSGLYVVASVTDNGSPAKNHDLYGHTATSDLATALNWCESNNAPVTNYTITGGNLVVHKS